MTPSGSIPSGPPWSLSFELWKQWKKFPLTCGKIYVIGSSVVRVTPWDLITRVAVAPNARVQFHMQNATTCHIMIATPLIMWPWKGFILANTPTVVHVDVGIYSIKILHIRWAQRFQHGAQWLSVSQYVRHWGLYYCFRIKPSCRLSRRFLW